MEALAVIKTRYERKDIFVPKGTTIEIKGDANGSFTTTMPKILKFVEMTAEGHPIVEGLEGFPPGTKFKLTSVPWLIFE